MFSRLSSSPLSAFSRPSLLLSPLARPTPISFLQPKTTLSFIPRHSQQTVRNLSLNFRKIESFPGRDITSSKNPFGIFGFVSGSLLLLYLLLENEKTRCEDSADGLSDKNSEPKEQDDDEEEEEVEEELKNVGNFRAGLPIFTTEEVSKHKTIETGIWVYYKEGVYNITDFVQGHPGGTSKIMLAAGDDLEVFWKMYAQHLTQEVGDILEVFRIGNLKKDPQASKNASQESGPYAKEPWSERAKILKVNNRTPFNAEAPLEMLTDYITPNDLFFIRNHLPVPHIKPEEYSLEIIYDDDQNGSQKIVLSLEDLKKLFPEHKVVSTIQCAGNRRSEQNNVKKVRGLDWTGGAISNAEWSGVLLTDILRHSARSAGVPEHQIEDYLEKKFLHVQFEGYDKDVTSAVYGASIPLDKALSPKNEVLLALEMNGKPLPLDHGYPVRVVVPGVVGARNVKWLNKIVLSQKESSSHWQQKDYKGFNSSVDWDTVDFTSVPAIQELPIVSAISEPSNNSFLHPSVLEDGEFKVRGFAYSGGGRAVIRVDVSTDEGKTWMNARLLQPVSSVNELNRRWSWTQWEVEVPVQKGIEGQNKKLGIICKAIDASYNNQPETVEPIWNLRGVLNNSWHRVEVFVPEKKD